MPSADDRKAWSASLKRAVGERPHGAGWVAEVDDLHAVAAITAVISKPGPDGIQRARWTMSAKPTVVDPLLWVTLDAASTLPTSRRRTALRVVGAFSLAAIPLGSHLPAVSGPGVDVDAEARDAVALLAETARQHRADVGDLAAWADLIDRRRAEKPQLPYLYRDLRVFTAIAMDDVGTARVLVDEALALHERAFVVGETTVWEMLDRDLRAGTGVIAR